MPTVTWDGTGMASDGANWDDPFGPVDGDDIVFDGAHNDQDCDWDIVGLAAGSITVINGFTSAIDFTEDLTISNGPFNLEGANVTGSYTVTMGGGTPDIGGDIGDADIVVNTGVASTMSTDAVVCNSIKLNGSASLTVTVDLTMAGELEVGDA